MNIAVDFDGSLVDHQFPNIGPPVPGAVSWLKRLVEHGAQLILWTMRCDSEERAYLTEAVDWCREQGIELFGINRDPDQDAWSYSPKAYAEVYVDDSALGCPLRANADPNGRLMADWSRIGPVLLMALTGEQLALFTDTQSRVERALADWTSQQKPAHQPPPATKEHADG